ncbi:aminoacyl-tRNA hydrolase [Candidatus Obscuribacterales bacterium]|nr:aminoacyl-tRNA hydrolase [Candidatus Obscuribacterales bacterium]
METPQQLKALVGLGNPGPEFEWTRHNAGFDVMDALAARLNCRFSFDTELNALVARPDAHTLIVKPQTGMNDSGATVKALVDKLGVNPSNIAIIYDDVSLPLGKLRFAAKGGAGGHHGIESTVAQLGGVTTFTRVRVAVGPDPGGAERFKFVLSPIATDLRDLYRRAVDTSAEACQLWLSASVDACMCKYNGLDLTRASAQ